VTDNMKPDQSPPASWPAPSASSRFVSEVVAGGAIGERNPDDDRTGVIGLIVLVGIFIALALANIWWFVFAVGLLLSIVLHEVGHYSTARWSGMKVTQFFVGFGPRVWSMYRRSTEFGVRALPLGAFVRIVGMNMMDDVDDADEEQTYRSKSYPKRMLVITAGSLMHFLLALVLLSAVFTTRGEAVLLPGAEVVSVGDNMPATGVVEPGDVIIDIDGVPVIDGALGDVVRSFDPGARVEIAIQREGVDRSVTATLGSNELVGGDGATAFLGVSTVMPIALEQRAWWSAPWHSALAIGDQMWMSTKGVVTVLNPANVFSHLSGDSADPMTRPTTLVGITAVSDDVGQAGGFAGIIELLAFLNVFVGVFNLFPLLPLDGGHAAIATYERVREGRTRTRYHADVARLVPLTMAVVAMLAFMFMSGLYLDIVNPIR
jgi:membrane-associated protease RseP (regulator of RpoE activity)